MGEKAATKKLCIGLLAHVDAGKTTLAEAILHLTGRIKTRGRVDHGSSVMDSHAIERERGISIFSGESFFSFGETDFSLLDTPGHVDFSAEMERAIQAMDCAVLIISGSGGVQAHTHTLWRLLGQYNIPCFIFVTKMDMPETDAGRSMQEIRAQLGEMCIDFSGRPDDEELAMCSEELLEAYTTRGRLDDGDIIRAVEGRCIVPCFFGSGLKAEGVEALLQGLDRYAPEKKYGSEFAARVYKISRDEKGRRLTHIKLTGGSIRPRQIIRYIQGQETKEEKVVSLRRCSGDRYIAAEEVFAGEICAVEGLSESRAGMGLGAEKNGAEPLLTPVMSYRLILPQGLDPMLALLKLRQLEEEDPMLRIVWLDRSREIQIQLMGRIQTQIIKSLIARRFDMDVELGAGRIIYRETIAQSVEGVGHYEPLRHYAEVHLLLEPAERGSGLQFCSSCSVNELDINWQRLILSHLEEKQHRGVLTGSAITDMRITLIAGRAHIKHTEGGDFRQATYRALRQGLMSAQSILLEPWYSFRIEIPAALMGRVISDIRAMKGEFSPPEDCGGNVCIHGSAPVFTMQDYAAELAAFSGGRGRISLEAGDYRPCHNSEQVISEFGYDPEADTENSPDSVFCAHGAGTVIKWNRVREYMHIDTGFGRERAGDGDTAPRRHEMRTLSIDDRELEAIMLREFGPIRRPQYSRPESGKSGGGGQNFSTAAKREFLIVDGYNVIHAWQELAEIAEDSLDTARHRLMDILASYRGFTGSELVLVFDAYRVPGNPGSKFDYHSIHIVYTADGETADAYIERLAHDIGKNYSVRIITSDNLIRVSAMRSGVLRTSAREFENEVDWVYGQISEVMKKTGRKSHMSGINFEGGGNGI